MQRINWNDVNGNPYSRKLHPLMLFLEGGLVEVRKTHIKGCTRDGSESEYMEVVYTADYVMEYVIRNVISPLAFRDKKSFLEFMERCYDHYSQSIE
jgi:hypothetical protein